MSDPVYDRASPVGRSAELASIAGEPVEPSLVVGLAELAAAMPEPTPGELRARAGRNPRWSAGAAAEAPGWDWICRGCGAANPSDRYSCAGCARSWDSSPAPRFPAW